MDNEILSKLYELVKHYNVTKLVQFGSSLENFEEANDIDFACDGLYDSNFFRFGANLEDLFKKNIDLIPLQPTSKFTDYILKNGKIIYEANF